MPWVGFEPITPASEKAKIFHALDSAATVIGYFVIKPYILKILGLHVTELVD
jgi:hypothetical protein